MEGSERDSTQDWVVPRGAVPSLGELEARIDEAVVIARASEEGVREVGEIALDAARQARKAAEMAESASAAAVEAAEKADRPAGPVTAGDPPPPAPPTGRGAEERPPREVVIDPLRRFNERADAVADRLRKLERVPV
jgi:hypothetical protein